MELWSILLILHFYKIGKEFVLLFKCIPLTKFLSDDKSVSLYINLENKPYGAKQIYLKSTEHKSGHHK